MTVLAHREDKSIDMGRRNWIKALGGSRWRNIVVLAILAVLLIGFVVDGWAQIVENWNAYNTDQSAYLRLALRIQQGIELTDGKRNPLYPAILALFGHREWSFFTMAKLLNLLIATFTLLAVYWAVKKVSSVHAALLTVFLLSHTEDFLVSGTKAVVEPLLILVMFVTWFFLWEAGERVWWWGLAGVGAGLTYLTKGTGSIVVMAFVLASVLIHRTRVFRQRTVWAFLAGFAALASGLWVYNTLTYGNPLYNWNTTHAMWLDQWQDKYVADSSQLPTATTYFTTRSPEEIIQRFLTGLAAVWPQVRDAWFPLRNVLIPACVVVALAVLIVKVASFSRKRRSSSQPSFWRRSADYIRSHREGVVFMAVLLPLWYLLFSWFSLVSNPVRFHLPLSPVVQCGLASALVLGVRTVLDELPWPKGNVRAAAVNLGYAALAVLAIVATSDQIVSHINSGELRDPFRSDRESNADGDGVLEWLAAQEDEAPVRVLYGPSKSLGGIWRYVGIVSHENVPSDLQSWDEMTTFLEEEQISWAVVDFELVDRRPELLGDYFSLDGKKITLKQPPPGWVLVHEVETPREHWFVFQIVQD